MRLCLITLFYFFFSSVNSQSLNQERYSGGMLILQPGYNFVSNVHQDISNMNYGIGGILRFYFSGYFTAGIYGGSNRTSYTTTGSENSYFNLGYGGIFAGFSRKTGNFRYVISAFAGGGKIKNLHIESQTEGSLTEAYFYQYPVMVFSPVLSMDYALTRKLSVTSQFVCLIAELEGERMMYNPLFQIGILFNR